MKKMKTKELLILAGATVVSMIAGMVVGCMKEKMKLNSYCVIDEL